MGEKIYELKKIKKKDQGMPLIGDKFPKMEVQTTHGTMKLPKAFKNRWFVFFSHPADFTPVCTTEFVSFQLRYELFEELDCGLIGLSVDQVPSHMKWIEWISENFEIDIEFPIIGDTGGVANKLGLIHPNKGTNTVRAVFIVDPKGIIRAILYYPQELGRNVDEILRMIEGFQTAAEKKVSIPANWPCNEIIGKGLIIPPPANIDEAIKRPGEYQCFDWWLCYRKFYKW